MCNPPAQQLVSAVMAQACQRHDVPKNPGKFVAAGVMTQSSAPTGQPVEDVVLSEGAGFSTFGSGGSVGQTATGQACSSIVRTAAWKWDGGRRCAAGTRFAGAPWKRPTCSAVSIRLAMTGRM